MLDDAEQVAALEPLARRWAVPWLEGARFVDALAGGEPVGEDLVEDGVADPGRRVDGHRSGCGRSMTGAAGTAGTRTGPVEARTTRCVWQDPVLGLDGTLPRDGGEQQLDGLAAFAGDRLMDRGQGRVEMRRDLDVVEADHADIGRHGQAVAAQGSDRPDRQCVAHRQDPGRAQAGAPGSLERRRAAGDGGRCGDDAIVAELETGRPERLPIAGQTRGRDPLRVMPRRGCRRLDPDDQDVAMAKLEEVLGGRPRPTDIVDRDRAPLGQGGRVDEHDRNAGATDLVDVGMVARQADRDHPVDRGVVHRAGQRAAQRRDELEGVARCLDGGPDPDREHPEERVREDDR